VKQFAIISGTKIDNVIVADSVETAEALTGMACLEFETSDGLMIGDEIDAATLKKIRDAKAKRDAANTVN
jgi:hypothetical protein